MKNEAKHTAHSSYRCKYNLVFVPKYRRKVIYKKLRKDIIEIIKGRRARITFTSLSKYLLYISMAQFVGTHKRVKAR